MRNWIRLSTSSLDNLSPSFKDEMNTFVHVLCLSLVKFLASMKRKFAIISLYMLMCVYVCVCLHLCVYALACAWVCMGVLLVYVLDCVCARTSLCRSMQNRKRKCCMLVCALKCVVHMRMCTCNCMWLCIRLRVLCISVCTCLCAYVHVSYACVCSYVRIS